MYTALRVLNGSLKVSALSRSTLLVPTSTHTLSIETILLFALGGSIAWAGHEGFSFGWDIGCRPIETVI